MYGKSRTCNGSFVIISMPWLLLRSSVLHISSQAKVRLNPGLVNLLSLRFVLVI